AFAAAGARVIAADRDTESARRTAEEARRGGAQRAWAETVDVSDERGMEKFAERVGAEYGVVDVLVNNAGVGLGGPFLDTTAEDWKRVLDVNLWGVIHGCRLFGRQMAERGGAEYGVVDVLVNNAGVGLGGPFLDTTAEDWKRVLDVNLWGVIHGCRLFGRQMAERGQGGHIVNVASAAAFLPSRSLPAYSTSK